MIYIYGVRTHCLIYNMPFDLLSISHATLVLTFSFKVDMCRFIQCTPPYNVQRQFILAEDSDNYSYVIALNPPPPHTHPPIKNVIHSYPGHNRDLATVPLKLVHGWITRSRCFMSIFNVGLIYSMFNTLAPFTIFIFNYREFHLDSFTESI